METIRFRKSNRISRKARPRRMHDSIRKDVINFVPDRKGRSLSKRQYEMTELHCKFGLVSKEVADVCGVAVSTASKTLDNARHRAGALNSAQLGYRFAKMEDPNRAA